ncbi:hypothetical protein [Bacillus halotolerans]|uniref:hypothetical protein n=1 Tax=Bacillus halotolerans TaxID=260554 RepID=UPI00404A3562
MSNAAVIVESELENALRKMNVCYNKRYENKGISFEINGSQYNVSVFDTGDEFLCNTIHATNKTETHIKIYKTIRGVTGYICRWLEK